MTDNARPQDIGRPHRRTRGTPAPEVEAARDAFRVAAIAELRDLIAELRPELEQLTVDGGYRRVRPPLADRVKLWGLAITLERALAASAELGWAGAEADAPAAPRPRAVAPRLTKRDRASLGVG